MWLSYSKKVTTNFFLLFRASPNCFFDIPILYLVDKIPRIIFVNKNVINNRVGLSFALRCMYLPVNVKGNPNRDFLKKRIKLKFQFSVILKAETYKHFSPKEFCKLTHNEECKSTFLHLTWGKYYLCISWINRLSIFIVLLKIFPWLKPWLPIQAFYQLLIRQVTNRLATGGEIALLDTILTFYKTDQA